ncbi:hypothetical protein Pyn_13603 [Prunus yedoensis var. nudiflora]|uniref:Uncharacterized protein n=1 Tax=Prunus yedoensis var. nudiflora TaxID=2094558 RepID=A0A314ZI08_PRUYE|nr:hypothetical protein Pyn_13603 [Prunus yedoensis var. nudiflora]
MRDHLSPANLIEHFMDQLARNEMFSTNWGGSWPTNRWEHLGLGQLGQSMQFKPLPQTLLGCNPMTNRNQTQVESLLSGLGLKWASDGDNGASSQSPGKKSKEKSKEDDSRGYVAETHTFPRCILRPSVSKMKGKAKQGSIFSERNLTEVQVEQVINWNQDELDNNNKREKPPSSGSWPETAAREP